MSSSAFAKPQAPWVSSLKSITTAETDDNKWHLLYALAYIADAGYDGDTLLLVLNHVCAGVPKLTQMITKMSRDPAFNPKGIDFSNAGSPQETVPHGNSTSSTADAAKFFLVNKTYTSMVKMYFPCSVKVSDTVVTFLTGLIPVAHTSPECVTLQQLHDKLCKILDVLSWVYRDLDSLGTSNSDSCLKKDALLCLNKFFDHCPTTLVGTIKVTLKLNIPKEQSTDNLVRWKHLRQAVSECACGGTPISKVPATPSSSPVLHANVLPSSAAVPTAEPTPNDVTEYLARMETSNAAFLSNLQSVLSNSTRGSSTSDRTSGSRSRSRSPSRGSSSSSRVAWQSPSRESHRGRDRDRDYDRDRYSRSRERRSQGSSNYHSGSSRSFTPACRDYARGHCRRGQQCRFNHSSANATSSETRICRYYQNNEHCPYGSGCRFSHGPSGTTPKTAAAPPKNKQLDKLTTNLNSLIASSKEQKAQLAALSAYTSTQKAAAEELSRTEAAEKRALACFQAMLSQQQGYSPQKPQGFPPQHGVAFPAITDNTRSPLSSNPFPMLGYNPGSKN